MLRLATITLLLSLCLPTLATGQIRAAGSTTLLPIIAEAAKVFRKLHPNITLTVSGGGSGVGITSLKQGEIEIGMSSRPLTKKEQAQLQHIAYEIPIAVDAVAIAVSKAVYQGGIRALTIQQVADIYRGKIRNWSELGGADSPILVIDKEPSRGTRHVFAKVVLGDERARAPGATIITGSNNEEQSAISRSDKAIGMLSNAWLNDKVRAIALIQDNLSLLPSEENIISGRYPIQRTLNILIHNDSSAQTKAFVGFLQSEQGQHIIQQVGYLPAQ